MTRPRRIALLSGLVILLGAGLVLAVTLDDALFSPDRMADRLRALEGWAPAAVIGLMIIHCFIPFPAELVALCAGALFGTILGTGLVWAGAMVGALLSFGLARYWGRPAIQALMSDAQAARLARWTPRSGPVPLLVCRMIPVIAFNLINYGAGLTRVGLWTFVWTTGLGILPLTTLSVYLGAQMREMDWPMVLAVSAAGVAVICGLHLLARRRGWWR